jgi:hypothetical protein
MQSKSLPQSIPRFQYQTAGAVFAEFLLLFFFEDAEGFARKIMATLFIDDTESQFLSLTPEFFFYSWRPSKYRNANRQHFPLLFCSIQLQSHVDWAIIP